MAKTIEEKLRLSQDRIAKERQKQKNWLAAENKRRRKERNHRIFTVGGHVESILKEQHDADPLDDYVQTVDRLLRIGLVVDEVLGRAADPKIVKYFLLNQEQRGHYFSSFTEQRENESDDET